MNPAQAEGGNLGGKTQMSSDRIPEHSMRLRGEGMHASALLGIEATTTRANQMDAYSRTESDQHQTCYEYIVRSTP